MPDALPLWLYRDTGLSIFLWDSALKDGPVGKQQ